MTVPNTPEFKINLVDNEWFTTLVQTQQPIITTAAFLKTKNYKSLQSSNKKKVSNKISDLFSYNKLSDYTGLAGSVPVRAGTTYVGVEIELEQIKYNCIPSGVWKHTEDGSLKDNGVEFVTIPIQFQYLEVELQRLFSGLKQAHSSTRCSVHVHLNSRDFTLEELKSFILLYMIFERSLYRFSGDRWNNNFCVPLFFYPYIVRYFIRYIDTQNHIPFEWFKYFGFNLSPLFGGESQQIGTIEFRHMQGNVDTNWIILWINLIVSLKISAKRIPFEELISHLETMNTTSAYNWLSQVVFKDYSTEITQQPTFKKDVESCITQAKTVFLKSKPVEEII